MTFLETPLPGAFLVFVKKIQDERGFFARTWCREQFAAQGLSSGLEQINVARSAKKGTLRGLHFQDAPYAEVKLVRCTRGAVHDVIVDLRKDSPTCCRTFATTLSEEEHNALYVPEGFAHGYQTLTDDAEISYQTSVAYHPSSARGVRHNDPAFGITWPMTVSVISKADSAWPDWKS